MKSLIDQYRPVLRFVLVFLGSYALMAAAYGLYLHWSQGDGTRADPITSLVAQQSTAVIQSFGYQASVVAAAGKPALQLTVEGKNLATIIEGCNAVSIIILFVAFVLSFAGRLWKTVLFLFAGAILVYAVNILRIAIIAVGIYEYPQWQEFLHGVLFPLLIYGLVFVLWLLWTRNRLKNPGS